MCVAERESNEETFRMNMQTEKKVAAYHGCDVSYQQIKFVELQQQSQHSDKLEMQHYDTFTGYFDLAGRQFISEIDLIIKFHIHKIFTVIYDSVLHPNGFFFYFSYISEKIICIISHAIHV